MVSMKKPVYCYILLCENKAFYTGWTKNIQFRFHQHNIGNGSKYTRLNRPIKIVYWENCKDKSAAMKREFEIKKLTRKQKELMVHGWNSKNNLPKEFSNYEYLSIAPGRVNLLGEHIDYNGGSVLPAAIDRFVYLGANQRNDLVFKISALDFNETILFDEEGIKLKRDLSGNSLPDWALYPSGVIWAALQKNYSVSGFEGIFTSTIPIGAGLSSSAAVEVAFAALLRELCSWDIDNLELARLCQLAENDYIGVNCGLMDQFASTNGIENCVLLFNTNTSEWNPIELPDSVSIVITNSKIPRKLSNSVYNQRRESCIKALKGLNILFPELSYLCQLSSKDFDAVGENLELVLNKRAKHVIYENERVNSAVQLLKKDKITEFGELMNQSHQSLKELFEVSTPEIDLLVSIAKNLSGCYGSRLTGAGFGGCIVSLVETSSVSTFKKDLESKYKQLSGLDVETYVCKASDGVKVYWHDLSKNNS